MQRELEINTKNLTLRTVLVLCEERGGEREEEEEEEERICNGRVPVPGYGSLASLPDSLLNTRKASTFTPSHPI